MFLKKILTRVWRKNNTHHFKDVWPLLFHRKVGQTHIKTSWSSRKSSEFIIFLIFFIREDEGWRAKNELKCSPDVILALSADGGKSTRTQEKKKVPPNNCAISDQSRLARRVISTTAIAYSSLLHCHSNLIWKTNSVLISFVLLLSIAFEFRFITTKMK